MKIVLAITSAPKTKPIQNGYMADPSSGKPGVVYSNNY